MWNSRFDIICTSLYKLQTINNSWKVWCVKINLSFVLSEAKSSLQAWSNPVPDWKEEVVELSIRNKLPYFVIGVHQKKD
jgi:hypothetical protein